MDPPLIGEDDPERVRAIVRVIGAAVVARRCGPIHPRLAGALEELELREPEWMARVEDRAAHLFSHPGH